MGMHAPRTIKSLILSTAMVLGAAGCSGLPELRPTEQAAAPISADEIPDINWPTVRTVHWLVADYTISPKSPLFQSGQAYRLVIRNTGDRTHVLDGQDFYNALAIKSLKMSAFAGHTGDEHVDEPIGAKGLDGVPTLPKLTALESPESEPEGEDSANPFAGDGEDGDTSDPFAAKEEGDEESGDQSTSATNPFAEEPTDDSEAAPAKEPVDTDVKVKGLPEPDSDSDSEQDMARNDEAEPEQPVSIIEDAADDNVDDPTGAKKADAEKDIDDAADDEPAATPESDETPPTSDDDSDIAANESESKDDTDDENKDIASDEDEGTETTPAGEVWTPIQISEIAIEPGHETTLEFVAIRPGRYALSSAHVLPTIFGMFTLATIDAPSGETKTAEAAAE